MPPLERVLLPMYVRSRVVTLAPVANRRPWRWWGVLSARRS
jgi:hypothetical protein